MARRTHSRTPMIVAVVGAALFLAAVLFGEEAWKWWQERLDAPPNVNGVDVDQVHRELFPAWVIAAAAPRGQEAEVQTYEALREALAPDDNLAALMERLHEVVTGKNLVEDAERVEEILGQWNGYLDLHEAPFQVSGGVVVTDRPMFYATSLHALSELTVRVGARDVRARIMERVDYTNIRERYLGAVMPGIDGAVILTDSVLEFALDRVWPVLDPEVPDEMLHATAGPFATGVQREAMHGLSKPTLALLRETAALRNAAVNAQRQVALRSGCSRFVLPLLGPSGVSSRDLVVLERSISYAECPAVTREEFEVLREASRTLASKEGLQDAVQELLDWSMRGIVVHEARHVADSVVHGDSIHCATCPKRTPFEIVGEISAYAASFAWSETPITTLYQACDAVAESPGLHRRAMEILLSATSSSCLAPPDDPRPVMRQFEAEAFSRDEAISLPDAFPDGG